MIERFQWRARLEPEFNCFFDVNLWMGFNFLGKRRSFRMWSRKKINYVNLRISNLSIISRPNWNFIYNSFFYLQINFDGFMLFIQHTSYNISIKCLALTRRYYLLLSITLKFRSVTAVYIFFLSADFYFRSPRSPKMKRKAKNGKNLQFYCCAVFKAHTCIDLCVLNAKLVKHGGKLCLHRARSY